MGKLLFFYFRVTNSKLKNKKIYFKLLIRKTKKQNLDFEVTRDFLQNETYNSELNGKNVGILDFEILDIDHAPTRYCKFMIMRLRSTCTALFCCAF